MHKSRTTRRDFIGAAAAASVAVVADQIVAQTSGASGTGVSTRVLGRTGVSVSILGLGGGHIRAIKDDAEAIRVMHTAVDGGLTFFDTAWDYWDGASEEIMGKALADGGYRNRVFLMSKNCGRDYKMSMQCLEDSLRRLRTDHLDLWQFHEVNYDNDPDWIFERGAIKAAVEARKAGKVRFIGFTGHKLPSIHLTMLSKPFEWDTCMMPINVADFHFRSFQNNVAPVCVKRNIGIVGFKGLGGRQGDLVGQAGLTVEECLRYSLSMPVATQVVGMTSLEHVKRNIAIARDFKPMPADEKNKLLARVKEIAGDGRFEPFKTQLIHDARVHREQHGFPVQ
jgi:uncharacterized protein